MKQWAGKDVIVHHRQQRTRFPIEVLLNEETGRKLALAISKLKQTTMMLPPEVEELLQALNYVLVGDPASVAAHRRMEAGKGMEPAAGDPRSYEAPK